MIVGQRIKARLPVVGLSQAELARRVGMSQSGMVNLIAGRSRSTSYLHKIARELHTTPAHLSGEVDDPDENAPAAPELDSEAREMLDYFITLSAADRRALLQVARSMSDGPSAHGTVQTKAHTYSGPEQS